MQRFIKLPVTKIKTNKWANEIGRICFPTEIGEMTASLLAANIRGNSG